MNNEECIKVFCVPFNATTIAPTSLSPSTLGDIVSLKICESESWDELRKTLEQEQARNSFESKSIRVVIVVDSKTVYYLDRNGIVKKGNCYYRIDKNDVMKFFKKLGYTPGREI